MPSTVPQKTISPPTPITGLRAGLRLLPHAAALAAFMCSAFACASSIFLLIALPLAGIQEESGFYSKLGIKAGVFAGLGLLCWLALRRHARTFPPRLDAPPLRPSEGRAGWGLVCVLLGFSLLLLPRLQSYPWTAPDELHHLIVARNLAQFGEYASGHRDSGFLRFDSYDSIGPPVVVPVAMAFRAFGSELPSARLVMATFFFLWLIAAWLFVRPVVGGGSATMGILLAGTAIGSIYLGRTLYGEVPALLYATAGLIYWRAALSRIRHWPWSLLAGACFGLTVLAKPILVIAVFPVGAAYVFDRVTYRRVPISRILVPGAAAFASIAGWTIATSVFGSAESGFASSLLLYRHYLLFGIDSAGPAMSWIGAHGITVGLLVAGLVSALPSLILTRYDPAALVLALIAVLFGFWWIFFTPGQIPRYLWYSLAIGGLLSGPLLAASLATARDSTLPVRARAAAAGIILAFMIPASQELSHVLRLMWFEEPMADEYALRDLLLSIPRSTTVETTSWMAQRSANFFTEKHLPRIEPAQVGSRRGYVVRDRSLEEFGAAQSSAIGRGRYVIFPPIDPKANSTQ